MVMWGAGEGRRRELALALLLLVVSLELTTPAAAGWWPFTSENVLSAFSRFVGDVKDNLVDWLYKAIKFLSGWVGGKSVKQKAWDAFKWLVNSNFNPFRSIIKDWEAMNAVLKLVKRIKKWGQKAIKKEMGDVAAVAQCFTDSWNRCKNQGWTQYVGVFGTITQDVFCSFQFAKECGIDKFIEFLKQQSDRRRLSSDLSYRRAGRPLHRLE